MGLLLEKSIKLITSDISWNLINKIDLTPLLSSGTELNLWINRTIPYCLPPCFAEEEINGMRNRISATESVIQKALKIVNQNNQQRTKREAPLYFIGQISRILFGTLDQEQGQKLHDIATKAYNKSIDIARLLLNQTEIISAKLSDLETHISKFDK